MNEAEIARRLEKLERDNRRLKGFAFATMVLAAAVGGIYATRPVPKTITAHAFEVVDNSGSLRARMSADPIGDTGIRFYDAHGALMRAMMAVLPSGESRIEINDAHEYTSVAISAGPSGDPVIKLNGPQGTKREVIGQYGIGFYDAGGSQRAVVGVNQIGAPFISLSDAQGFSMDLGSTGTENLTTGQTQQTSAASIVMFGNGKGHHVIWQAP
ncbi:MAG TPA: hypothetical protein VMX16_11050 [Terriglobia bacterium]|nr:hypothetical protein [Terriglobia bacterium]